MTDEPVQLLTPDGVRVEHPEFSFDGDDAMLAGMLREMMLTRRLDAECTALQRHGELGLWAPSLGQEATQIGSVHAMRDTEMIFPSYREHGVTFARGITVDELLTFFRGTGVSGWNPRDKQLNSYTVIIADQTLQATGYAMGLEKDGLTGDPDDPDTQCTIVYFGDGATSEGATSEAMIFANSYHAPIVFLCTNNQWAISEPVTRQSPVPLYRRAAGFGMPGVRVDGNDALAVYAVTQWATRRARAGQGPAMIESFTYRMGAHTTSDDPTKYRSDELTESWRAKDPVERLRRYLISTGEIDDGWVAAVDAEAETYGEHIRSTCLAMPEPVLRDLWPRVYAEQTEHLRRQAAGYDDYLAGFADEEAAQ